MKTIRLLCVVLAAVAVLGCNNILGGNGGSSGGSSSGPAGDLSLDLTGAKALALGGSAATTSNLGARDLTTSEVVNDSLYKILEDGTLELAIDLGDNDAGAEIQFIAADPEGNVYLSFSWPFGESNIGLYYAQAGTNNVYAVNAANVGRYGEAVKNWYWNDGMRRTKPIVFGGDGTAYFVLPDYSSGWGGDRVYAWRPGSGDAVAKTPALDGVEIQRFEVDSEKRLYVYGYMNGVTTGNFLQVFDPEVERGAYLFYEGSGNGWIQGYVAAGSKVYLNGWGIYGGVNGIVEISSSVVDDQALEFDIQELYDNNASDWFNPRYNSWVDSATGKVVHEGLFESVSEGFEWADYWRVDATDPGSRLDADRILDYLAPYFVEDIAFDFDGDGVTDEPSDDWKAADKTYNTDDVLGAGTDNWHYLSEHVVHANDPVTPAVSFKQWRTNNGIDWFAFDSVSDMYLTETGELWGIYNPGTSGSPVTLIRLLDNAGERALRVVRAGTPTGTDARSDAFVLDGDTVYYRYKGDRIGTHRLASIDHFGSVRDITANVTDIQFMTIYDYSVGGGVLYFTGFDGIEKIAGRIDLATLEYSRISSDSVLTSIEVVR